jgi:LacI family transcriptional regulator
MQPGYFNYILSAILSKVDTMGHNVLIFSNVAFHKDIQQSLRIYCDGRCDGVVIISPPPASPIVEAVRERGMPFVVVGSTGDEVDIPSVDVNNVEEATRIVSYLIELGHKRVAYLGDPSRYEGDPYVPFSAMQRRMGYEYALTAHGLNPKAIPTVAVGPDDRDTYEQTIRLLSVPPSERPTALFCWHDRLAGEVYRAVRDLGLRIPDDISVVGFDDDSGISHLSPRLTTVRQPYEGIGEAAIDLMTRQLNGLEPRPQRTYLPAELIIRESASSPVVAATPES